MRKSRKPKDFSYEEARKCYEIGWEILHDEEKNYLAAALLFQVMVEDGWRLFGVN